MKKRTRVSFAPMAYPGAEILILGSMPGERSLQLKQYYGHSMNQFWRVLQEIFGAGELRNYQSKKALLRDHGIAVWDVVKNCHRCGSSDLSIRKAKANDIFGFLAKHPGIRHILLNGRTTEEYFVRFFGRAMPLPYDYVPSTSPAHAGLNFKTKLRLWKQAFTKAGIRHA
ncbi:MAG: DNA-deoxyinosine glycosylase [Candidatus Omnitrophota bacterium]